MLSAEMLPNQVPRIHLILDDKSVAQSRGVTFHLNSARKHPENPVMLPGEPHQWDSLCVSWPGTVLYSPRDRKFRCWYVGMDVVQSPDRVWNTGYAESDDGIHWTKPDLGQIDFQGKPTNRIANDWKASFLSLVFENSRADAPPSQRFGGYWTSFRFASAAGDWSGSLWRKDLAWSPDGARWSFAGTAYAERPRAPLLDISQVLYDPTDPDPLFRWKAYGQRFRARPDGTGWPGIRHIGLAYGADVSKVEDAAKSFILSPVDGLDEEIHFAAVQKLGSDYLMLFESDSFSKNPIRGDLRLAVSKDGREFRRVHPQTPLVATGPKGMWDENLLVTNTAGWLEVGDEVRIYYFGCPNTFNSWPSQYTVSSERRGSLFAPVYLGLAILPRDRFAYVSGDGTLTTHPLELTGEGLWLNADGEPRTTALDQSGRPQARGQLGQERRQTVYRRVVWDQAEPRGSYRLEIGLSHGDKLFSLACV